MAIRREIEFELEEPIQYAVDGGTSEATLVILKAPTTRNRRDCLFLKQQFLRALHEVSGEQDSKKKKTEEPEDETDTKEEEPDPEEVAILIGSSSVDLGEFFDRARALMCRGSAFIEGKVEMTTELFDRMSMEDSERMIGSYMVNFIVRSVLMKQKKASSKT
ncbi:hypothetical protein LCGC14_0615780 [marine sediment metagenome]|uniref:Uncharacterized protein n=1 Tax=marine sediment metagenome TaxID=412755 RepID=A0A0F9RB27_9ZZZZ